MNFTFSDTNGSDFCPSTPSSVIRDFSPCKFSCFATECTRKVFGAPLSKNAFTWYFGSESQTWIMVLNVERWEGVDLLTEKMRIVDSLRVG